MNVVPFTPAPPAPPPTDLGPVGRKLWEDVCAEYVLDTVGERTLLHQACVALDKAEELWASSKPADIKTALACRTLATRLLCRMGLHALPLKAPGRPTNYSSWNGRT